VHFLFAWRYFRGKYAFQAIQIIAWVSVFAIAIGTAALITILSVSNGFSSVVKGLYADFYADLSVTPKNGKYFSLNEAQYIKLKNIKGVKAISRVVESRALLVKGGYQTVAIIKGVENSYRNINKINKYLKRGESEIGDLQSPLFIMGIGVENKLGLMQQMIGDTLQVFAVNRSGKSITQIGQLNNLTAQQSGTFSVQQEFDDQYVFTNLQFAQYLFDLNPVEVSSIEIAIDEKDEKNASIEIQKILGQHIVIKNRYQQNIDLYKIMQVEKWIIFCILALIMVVASFNLVGALTMLVLEKEKDIHVLNAMGASQWDIQKIFLILSGIMALLGAFIGGGIASLFCWLQYNYHFIKLGGGSFVIDYYPIQPMLIDYVSIMTLVIVIAILAGWIPSRKAAAKIYERIV
jgi:lipoprotein-releasing system permease protein